MWHSAWMTPSITLFSIMTLSNIISTTTPSIASFSIMTLSNKVIQYNDIRNVNKTHQYNNTKCCLLCWVAFFIVRPRVDMLIKHMTLSPNDTQNNVIQYNDTQHCVSTMIMSIVSVQWHSALESFSKMTLSIVSVQWYWALCQYNGT